MDHKALAAPSAVCIGPDPGAVAAVTTRHLAGGGGSAAAPPSRCRRRHRHHHHRRCLCLRLPYRAAGAHALDGSKFPHWGRLSRSYTRRLSHPHVAARRGGRAAALAGDRALAISLAAVRHWPLGRAGTPAAARPKDESIVCSKQIGLVILSSRIDSAIAR